MATREEIDRVRQAVNIVDVVSLHVALKRNGSVWKGLCPFHSEKTPSFQVTPNNGRYYCFGCSKNGDAFTFLEETEGLTFAEALNRLADNVGITLSKSSQPDPIAGKREQLYEALEQTTKFYQEMLVRNDVPRTYLAGRNISPEMIQRFRLGYSPDSPDALVNYLRKVRVDPNIAVEAGVIAKGDRQYGGMWDKLRGRLICPIIDIHERPIAFGGRLMEDVKDRAKYLNTAETPFFSKGKTFYAMPLARKTIVDTGFAIVVEGYFDVISAHQNGFTNVIATLGTALTDGHTDQLLRHVQQVRLAFDADAAGVRAADKSAKLFEDKGIDALVLDLPQGDDPDSLLRAGRADDFRLAIENARPIREFKIRTILDDLATRPRNETQKMQVFKRAILPVLTSTKSVIDRDRYIRMCAPGHPMYVQGAALAELQIRQEVDATLGVKPVQSNDRPDQSGQLRWSKPRNGTRRESPSSKGPVSPPKSGIAIAEDNILQALYGDDEKLSRIVVDGLPEVTTVLSEPAQRLARRLLNIEGTGQAELKVSRASLISQIDGDDEVASLASRILSGAEVGAPLTGQVVQDSLARLRRESNLHKERDLKARADLGDDAAVKEQMRILRDAHKTGTKTGVS